MTTSLPLKYIYVWSGTSAQGQLSSGEIHAMSKNVAHIYLKEMGITPLRIRKKTNFISAKLFQKKMTPHEIAAFFRQLAILITAGIPILQSIEILRQTQNNMLFRDLLNQLKNEIAAGNSLKESLQKFPSYFDAMVCHLIHIGEQTGRLDSLLNRIALYKEKSLRLKKQITQALLYPSMICVTALIVTFVMLTFVVPRFEELFKNMNKALPAFTQYVIYFSAGLRHHMELVLLPFFGIGLLIYYYKRSTPFKQRMDQFIIKIPLLKHVLQKIILARLTRNFSILFAAGIPVLDALTILMPLSSNYAYSQAIQTVRMNVANGEQIHVSLQKNPLFPILVIQMIKVGEESGTLESMLTKLAELYESEIDHWVANLSHLLEPLIMIVLGVLIGGLVIAMYLPIFKLGTII